MSDQIPPQQETPAADLVDSGVEALTRLRALAGDVLGLLGLEARLAGLSLAAIVAAALLLGFSLMAGWLLLQGALAYALIRVGADPLLALGLLVLLNFGISVALLLLIRRLGRNLMFRATTRTLRGDDGVPPA